MFTRRAVLSLASLVFAAAASAQTATSFPTKPVQVIVPYAAGGVTDILARIIALRLADKWKQPVIVDNKPGAGTVIGTAAAARAPGDGHTLFITAFGFTANQVLVPIAVSWMQISAAKPARTMVFTPIWPSIKSRGVPRNAECLGFSTVRSPRRGFTSRTRSAAGPLAEAQSDTSSLKFDAHTP